MCSKVYWFIYITIGYIFTWAEIEIISLNRFLISFSTFYFIYNMSFTKHLIIIVFLIQVEIWRLTICLATVQLWMYKIHKQTVCETQTCPYIKWLQTSASLEKPSIFPKLINNHAFLLFFKHITKYKHIYLSTMSDSTYNTAYKILRENMCNYNVTVWAWHNFVSVTIKSGFHINIKATWWPWQVDVSRGY